MKFFYVIHATKLHTMKKSSLVLFVSLTLFTIQSFAGINFIQGKSWKEVLALAKKQNKLIFLDAYATWCGPCKYLQKNVFTDESVGDFFNANFINVKMDMEEGEGIQLSEDLGVASYPTLFFINGDDKVVHKTVGAMEAHDFISLGKDAVNPATQFYTIKEKAHLGKMIPADFHKWVHTAEELSDPDVEDIVKKYIAANSFPMMEKEMLLLLLDHGTLLPKTYLDQLYKNREEAAKMIEVPADIYKNTMLQLVVNYADNQSTKNDVTDFVAFKKIVEAYYPQSALLETQKLKVNRYIDQKNNAKGLEALHDLITNPVYSLSAVDMAVNIISATNAIADENKGNQWLDIVQAYQLKPEDKSKGYYKDLALLVLHFRMDNTDKVQYYSKKILDAEDVPEAVTRMVNGLLE